VSRVVRAATNDDIPSWLELVEEVVPLFGPMPDFADHARRGIERGSAIVVVDGRDVLGAALLSAPGHPCAIHWLSVRASHRNTGVASLLMTEVLRRWPDDEVSVVTFTAQVIPGRPARRLYERFGFERVGAADPAPDGGDRDLFVRRRHNPDSDHAPAHGVDLSTGLPALHVGRPTSSGDVSEAVDED
jgi:GNAT superfamily N-acetyltransferase